MGKDISDETIKEIQECKNKGLNKYQTSKKCHVSWNTVDKYWNEGQKISLGERNRKRSLIALSREDYQRIYRYFNGNRSVDYVIEITGIREAREIFEEYCSDKLLPSPRDVKDFSEKFYTTCMEMKKKMEEWFGFEKRLEEMEKKVNALYEHFKPVTDQNHDGDRPMGR